MMKPSMLTLLLCLSFVTSVEADVLRPTDMFREAKEGWARLRFAESHVVGTTHIIYYRKDLKTGKGFYRMNRFHDFKIKDGFALVATHSPGINGQNIQIVNPRYQAQLDQKTSDAPMVLVGYQAGPVPIEKNVAFINTEVYQGLQLHRSLYTIPFEQFIADKNISFKNVHKYNESGRPRVRIEFDYLSRPLTDSKKQWIIFSPDDDWAMLEAKYYVREDWSVTIRNEVKKLNGSVLLTKSEEFNHFSKDNLDDTYGRTFSYREGSDPPDSEFSLSAYGLPEPDMVKTQPSRYFLHTWFIGGGALLMVLAGFMRWSARRSRT